MGPAEKSAINTIAPIAPIAQDAHLGAALAEVLHREEVARARTFFRTLLVLLAVLAAFLPALPDKSGLRMAALGVVVVCALLCAAGSYIARDPARYTQGRIAALAMMCGAAGVGILYYFGIFCAGAMILTLGIYFFGTSSSRAAARGGYAVVALVYLVLSAGLAAGALPDVALFPITHVAPATLWFQVAMSQVFFAVTFYMAQRNRDAMATALLHAQRAAMQIRQRDAQLAEARRELDRALRADEGRRSGEVLGGYRLGALIGRGGMGEVYRATHAETGHVAAVKVLHASLLGDEEHVRRFLREAEIAASVRTRHVVELLALGRAPGGAPYLVMELLEGHDLGWLLRHRGRLPVAEVVELVEQLASALTVLRDAGVVHRDLKPANLFLAQEAPPLWKVLDFGIAKALGRGATLTQGQILGTPSYMAPEQLGGDVDHRTDLYALAAIAYRTLTGSAPFEAEDAAHVAFKVLFSRPPAPAHFVQIPSDVELVLALGLAKKPEDRFERVEDMAHALRLAAAGELDEVTRARGWRHLKAAPWDDLREGSADPARVA